AQNKAGQRCVWGYRHLGAWTPLHISAHRRARICKEVSTPFLQGKIGHMIQRGKK
ncbi:hypothetical protein Tsubulata_049950, partial [Turnera subulata]